MRALCAMLVHMDKRSKLHAVCVCVCVCVCIRAGDLLDGEEQALERALYRRHDGECAAVLFHLAVRAQVLQEASAALPPPPPQIAAVAASRPPHRACRAVPALGRLRCARRARLTRAERAETLLKRATGPAGGGGAETGRRPACAVAEADRAWEAVQGGREAFVSRASAGMHSCVQERQTRPWPPRNKRTHAVSEQAFSRRPVCVYVCVCARARACVRACERARARVCVVRGCTSAWSYALPGMS